MSHRKLPNCWVEQRSMSQAFVVKRGILSKPYGIYRALSPARSWKLSDRPKVSVDEKLPACLNQGLQRQNREHLKCSMNVSCLWYRQSQQRSRHELRASHKTTNQLNSCLRLVLSGLCYRFFLRHSNIPEIFPVFNNTTYMYYYYNNKWLNGVYLPDTPSTLAH